MQASKMHKKIMADMKKLHKRYSFRKALRSAIYYRNSMFRKLLEDDISDGETDDERTYLCRIFRLKIFKTVFNYNVENYA